MLKMYTKLCSVALILAGLLLAIPSYAAPLPDVLDEWDATTIITTELTTTSEDFGYWQNRIYKRFAPIAQIEVNLMDGAGPGTLYVPSGTVSHTDAPLGFSSGFRTLEVGGRKAILESGEVTGMALAIRFDTNQTLTLESKSISESELLNFAERLIFALSIEEVDF